MWLPVIKSLRWLGHRFAGMSVCSVAGQSVPIVLHLNCPHGIIRGGFQRPRPQGWLILSGRTWARQWSLARVVSIFHYLGAVFLANKS